MTERLASEALAEIERLHAIGTMTSWHDHRGQLIVEVRAAWAEHDALTARVAELAAALRWYAEPGNWDCVQAQVRPDGAWVSRWAILDSDTEWIQGLGKRVGGHRARNALARGEGTDNG